MDLVIDDAASRAGGKAKKPQLSKKDGGLNIGGGMSHSQGIGFGGLNGSQRRSQKSKSRDRNKKQHRRDH
jgi:hypothetical protein